MKELRILVKRDTLLPVRYGQLTHNELQQQLRQSLVADGDQSAWKIFTDTVEGITYVSSEEEYTGEGVTQEKSKQYTPLFALRNSQSGRTA